MDAFLSNVLDKFNVYFLTTKACTIHKLRGETVRLFKKVLTFFVRPSLIRADATCLISINVTKSEHQFPDSELFIGDDTTAFLLDLSENEGISVKKFLWRG